MIRFLKRLTQVLIALALIVVALANRDPVTVALLPADLAALTGWGWTLTLPLFLILFAAMAIGVMLGFVWEWWREGKHRSAASARAREAQRLQRELAMLRDAKGEPEDEVLAILDRKKAS